MASNLINPFFHGGKAMSRLVLSANINERILVGDTWVEVVQVRGQQVRIAFDGPRGVPIDREVVHHRKQKQSHAA
jgi:carbon storage regulator CsrA